MSAIWGIVRLSKSAVIPGYAYDTMKHSYEERCKIDRYNMISFEDGYVVSYADNTVLLYALLTLFISTDTAILFCV